MALYSGKPTQISHSGGRNASTTVFQTNLPTFAEDVIPEHYVHQNVQTPFMATAGRRTVNSTYHEWIMSRIPDNSWATTFAFGDTEFTSFVSDVYDEGAKFYSTRAGNYVTKLHRGWSVSDDEDTQMEYGVASTYDKREFEEAVAFMLDWERTLIFNRPASAGSTPGDALLLATASQASIGSGGVRRNLGLAGWASDCGRTPTSNVTINGTVIPGDSSATNPDGFTSTYYAGSGSDISRPELIQNILMPYWNRGGQLSRAFCYVGSRVKNVLDQLSTIYSGSGATLTAAHLNERSIAARDGVVIDYVDVYNSTWGDMFIIKTHLFANEGTMTNWVDGSAISLTPSKSMLIWEPNYVDVAVKIPFKTEELPRTGTFRSGVHHATLGVIVGNPRCLAFAHNIAA